MEGAAQSLVNNVAQLLAAEYRQLSGVGGEIVELRDDLDTMNALLRMQSEAEEGAVDHFVRVWMKQLRELAYDAEDSIDLYLLRIKCHPRAGVLARFIHLFTTLNPRHRLAGEIGALRARAITISERHARYGVNREALRRTPFMPAVPSMLVASASNALALRRTNDPEHRVVGVDGKVKKICLRLMDSYLEKSKRVTYSDENERCLELCFMVGPRGAGKTTLATEVCRQLEPELPYQAMVSVSQAFEPSRDLKALLKSMLEQIVKPKTHDGKGVKQARPLDGIDGLDADKLAEMLKDSLKNKRYLIVMDDVWTRRAWESIQSVLPWDSDQGGIIIITTPDDNGFTLPAGITRCFVCPTSPLNPEDAKQLFLRRVYGTEYLPYIEEGSRGLMDTISKNFCGLPLAIVCIAGVLAEYVLPISGEFGDKWETICRSIDSQIKSNLTLQGMKHIITLCYNHLPHELKSCMMYLSVFPEDYVINKDRLLSRWIAEGLVPKKGGMSLMEVAESYLKELASRNMIEPCFGYNGNIESCRMHDMLLEVMVSKSLESNFVSLLGGQYAGMPYERIRRLSIRGDDIKPQGNNGSSLKENIGRDLGHGIEEMDVKHVRSLSIFQYKGHKLLDHLDKFTLLRVLDLEDCEGLTNHHMRYICRLHLLKFLSLKGTRISEVPPQVEKLEHLQTFDVRGTNLSRLPKTVTNLEKLERLQFTSRHGWSIMWRLPNGLSKMKELREVNNAVIGKDAQTARELGELEQLQELCLYMDSDDIKDDMKVLEELANSLSKAYSLQSLNMGDIGSTSILQFLHNLPSPPRLLQYLRITGRIGGQLPYWIVSVTNLAEIFLSWVYLSDDEPYCILCKLPNLKSIGMDGLYYTGNELVARTSHNFPTLVNLSVARNESEDPTPRVVRFEVGSMRKLKKLQFEFNSHEKSFEGIEHLKYLEEVQLIGPKNNPALDRALEQLKAESRKRPETIQFQIAVKYV